MMLRDAVTLMKLASEYHFGEEMYNLFTYLFLNGKLRH